MSKNHVRQLLQINDLDRFREAITKAFSNQRLTPDVIGTELARHWERLLWGENPETIENHTDPRRRRGD